MCRKHQTYESATLAQAANSVTVSKEQDKQLHHSKRWCVSLCVLVHVCVHACALVCIRACICARMCGCI